MGRGSEAPSATYPVVATRDNSLRLVYFPRGILKEISVEKSTMKLYGIDDNSPRGFTEMHNDKILSNLNFKKHLQRKDQWNITAKIDRNFHLYKLLKRPIIIYS